MVKVYIQFKVEQLHQVLFKDLLLLLVKMEAVEDEEEAKLRAEVEKIGILALAAVNTDANVLPVRIHDPALVPVAVDMLSI
jgi:hypothetical protein